MTPELLPDQDLHRALVVVAHPDDVDFAAAGTVARWTAAGATVVYCVVTDGEAGFDDDAGDRRVRASIRRAEQLAAGRAVGVTDIRFLGCPDGELTVSLDLRRDITRVIREVRPNRVLTHSPEIAWEMPAASHPDHRATGEATLGAVYPDARNPLAHRRLLTDEKLAAWPVRELWVMGGPRSNHHPDITDTFDRKVAALRAHRSQVGDAGVLVERLRDRHADLAGATGLPAGRLAERFLATVFG
ncbi:MULTISPECIES: PIG-L deacetylase family protein [Micromonospora]|uniref:PIG-L deacetylase family protein n=1 Tax=Micromonospora TaxID=1873 RepID=UPI0033D27319